MQHLPTHPPTRPETLYLALVYTATALPGAGLGMGYAWLDSVRYCLSEVMDLGVKFRSLKVCLKALFACVEKARFK